jgi:hypothetical protein
MIFPFLKRVAKIGQQVVKTNGWREKRPFRLNKAFCGQPRPYRQLFFELRDARRPALRQAGLGFFKPL